VWSGLKFTDVPEEFTASISNQYEASSEQVAAWALLVA
jgi:hypothetical protein